MHYVEASPVNKKAVGLLAGAGGRRQEREAQRRPKDILGRASLVPPSSPVKPLISARVLYRKRFPCL